MLRDGRWDAVIVDGAVGRSTVERIGALIGSGTRAIVLVAPRTATRFPPTGTPASPTWSSRCAPARWRPGLAPARAGAPPRRPRRRAPDGRRPCRTLAILVAEDNEINALLTRHLLSRLGHHPVMVATGGEAVTAFVEAQAEDAPFDVVLMDLHLPGMDGIEAARRIRAAESGDRRTPIIALTADAFPESRDACLAAGMDGFVTKPLDRERLTTALARVASARAA